MNSRIAHLRALVRERRFENALNDFSRIADEDMTEELWVLRGVCIQLADKTDFPLSEAKRSFECALSLNPNHVEAALEMAWFLLNVEDDSKAAESGFAKALSMLATSQESALRGCAKCKEELESIDAARDFVSNFPVHQATKDRLLHELASS